ncbi:unnamed protein product [Ilex paraguariensis]|uniref:Chromo domain-containing protein n=1 Tax=Ilex paraguariensis TaxID=185542 RepID=A0ABC8SEH7_9AQUA
MVRVRPKRYPKGVYNKLHSKSVSSYKIMKKMSSNAYVLNLLKNMGISNVFNTENLTLYRAYDDNTPTDVTVPKLPPDPRVKEETEDIIDHQLVSTRGGGYQKYLIKWIGGPLSDCTWITDNELQCLNPNFYEQFHAFNSLGLSFFKPERDDGDK